MSISAQDAAGSVGSHEVVIELGCGPSDPSYDHPELGDDWASLIYTNEHVITVKKHGECDFLYDNRIYRTIQYM